MTDDPLKTYVEGLTRSPGSGSSLWLNDHGDAVGRFLGLDLAPVFQPVREARTRRIVGHEAYIRSHDDADEGLSPWKLFSQAATDEQLIELDRACRTIHAIRYFVRRPTLGALFLNVHGRLMAAVQEDHGRTFRRVLDSLAIPASRVVIESPEGLTENLALLGCVMQNYRRNGYRVAINLASSNQASALLNRFAPDFVKIDVRHLSSPDALTELAARTARRGVRVIVKRVETPDHVSIVERGGADFLQGFAFDLNSSLPAAPVGDPSPAGASRKGRTAAKLLEAQQTEDAL